MPGNCKAPSKHDNDMKVLAMHPNMQPTCNQHATDKTCILGHAPKDHDVEDRERQRDQRLGGIVRGGVVVPACCELGRESGL